MRICDKIMDVCQFFKSGEKHLPLTSINPTDQSFLNTNKATHRNVIVKLLNTNDK